MGKAPYKRGYHHTKKKGKESIVHCGFCRRKVPRYKTIPVYRGFRVNDPLVRKEVENKYMRFFTKKEYACPACARFHGIVRKKR